MIGLESLVSIFFILLLFVVVFFYIGRTAQSPGIGIVQSPLIRSWNNYLIRMFDYPLRETFDLSGLLSRVEPGRFTMERNGVVFNVIISYDYSKVVCRPRYSVTFSYPSILQEQVRMRIVRRGLISKALGMEEGQYNHLNEDLGIYGSNLLMVKTILNDNYNLQIVERVLAFMGEVDTTWEQSFECNNSESLLTSCNDVIELISILSRGVKEVHNEDRYPEAEIMAGLDLTSVLLRCVICYQGVKVDDSYVTDCCTAIAHKTHMTAWLDAHENCPYCRKDNVVIYSLPTL